MRSTGEWAWPIAVGLAAALFEWLLGTVWRNRKQARARSWPMVFGHITKATVFSGKEIILTLSYSYPVADELCPILADFEKSFYSTDHAQAWADALADQSVPVYVNPRNSWKSMLLDSDLETMVKSMAEGQKTGAAGAG